MTIAQQLRNLYDNLVIAINFINEGINLKAAKVSSATSGNLAGLDSTGNLTDSGYAQSMCNLIPQSVSKRKSFHGRYTTNIGIGRLWGSGASIYSFRLYNRELSIDEMLHNQQIDNERFNLGL